MIARVICVSGNGSGTRDSLVAAAAVTHNALSMRPRTTQGGAGAAAIPSEFSTGQAVVTGAAGLGYPFLAFHSGPRG